MDIPQRRHTDHQKAHEKILVSLIIRELHIKTTVAYHLRTIRMAIIKMSVSDECWRGVEKRGTLPFLGTISMENNVGVH